jgi:hypothetical protein
MDATDGTMSLLEREFESIKDRIGLGADVGLRVGEDSRASPRDGYIVVPRSLLGPEAVRSEEGRTLLRATIVHELMHIELKGPLDDHRRGTLGILFMGDHTEYLPLITLYTYYEGEGWLDRRMLRRFRTEALAKQAVSLVEADEADLEGRLMNAAALSVVDRPWDDAVAAAIASDWRRGRVSDDHLELLLTGPGAGGAHGATGARWARQRAVPNSERREDVL